MHIPHRIVPDFKPSPQLKRSVFEEMRQSGKFIQKSEDSQTDIFSDFGTLIDE